MKPIPRRTLLSLIVLGATFPACRGGNDRQMVITKPRVAPVQVDTAKGVNVKAPFVNVQVPSRQQIPASAGVDVPVIQPE